jgi:large subunit ribosomal protein L36e
MTSHGIAIGLKNLRGYQVTKIQKVKKTPKKHTKNLLVKDVIREITGLAPYEKRVQEFIKNGLDKRALRLASRRVCCCFSVELDVLTNLFHFICLLSHSSSLDLTSVERKNEKN